MIMRLGGRISGDPSKVTAQCETTYIIDGTGHVRPRADMHARVDDLAGDLEQLTKSQ